MDGYDEELSIICTNQPADEDELDEWLEFMDWIEEELRL